MINGKPSHRLPEDLIGFIEFWQKVLDSIPQEDRYSAKVETEVEEDYGSYTSEVSVYYTRAETEEEAALRVKEEETNAEKCRKFDLIQLNILQKRLGII